MFEVNRGRCNWRVIDNRLLTDYQPEREVGKRVHNDYRLQLNSASTWTMGKGMG